MSSLLCARDLRQNYGNVHAVKGINLEVETGTCFGLLGPNGAGKSTTLEMLEGLSSPAAGEVLFRGRPINQDYRERIGIQFQQTALPDYLTVRECLNLFASFYRQAGDIPRIIELCQLGEIADRLHYHLSGGQRQRLLLALSLINDPELLFLDEPTTGLDPQARHSFWQLVHAIKRQGKTVVLTTHYMDEAAQLCDTLAIMDHGNIIAEGAPQTLLQRHFLANMVELPGEHLLADHPSDRQHQRGGHTAVECNDIASLLGRLEKLGLSLEGLSVRKPNLEDLFLKLTGHQLAA